MTFVGFLIFGIVPLIPYLFRPQAQNIFPIAIAGTAAALILLGATRSVVTRERIYRGALEIVALGGITAVVAYGIGYFLRELAVTFVG